MCKPNNIACLVQSQMSVEVTAARSQQCLKRLLDEHPDNLPNCKQARLAPHPPTARLPPCLRTRSLAPKSNHSQFPSRVGQYFLLERCEGEETYRAEHAHTKQQYTCQVLMTQITKDNANNISTIVIHNCVIVLLCN